jgi:hypothetical protein
MLPVVDKKVQMLACHLGVQSPVELGRATEWLDELSQPAAALATGRPESTLAETLVGGASLTGLDQTSEVCPKGQYRSDSGSAIMGGIQARHAPKQAHHRYCRG